MDEMLKELQDEFISEVVFLLEQCEEAFLALSDPSEREEQLALIFRLAHSIKGTGSAVGLTDMAQFAHKVEDFLSLLRVDTDQVNEEIISLLLRTGDAFKDKVEIMQSAEDREWDVEELAQEVLNKTNEVSEKMGLESKTKDKSPTIPQLEANPIAHDSSDEDDEHYSNEFKSDDTSNVTKLQTKKTKPSSQIVKVGTDKLEAIIDIVGELIVLKNQLAQNCHIKQIKDSQLENIISQIDKNIIELHERSSEIKLTPLKPVFLKAQRTLRDLSQKLEKPIDINIEGEETPIDRNVLDKITDPIIHIVRNAIDHGLETIPERSTAGKDLMGKININAHAIAGKIFIEISDDGKGIDREKILKKAMDKSLIPASKNTDLMTDEDVFGYLFHPGFSTAEKITDVSGRGVGLDSVKSNVEALNGKITIQSNLGTGSRFIIELPLSSSLTDAMEILCNQHRLTIPLNYILDIVTKSSTSLEKMGTKGHLLRINDQLHEEIPLKRIINTNSSSKIYSKHVELPHLTKRNDALFVSLKVNNKYYYMEVDRLLGQRQIVVKNLVANLSRLNGISGGAVMVDGNVVLHIEPELLVSELEKLKDNKCEIELSS